jgi:ornithine decarboxylase
MVALDVSSNDTAMDHFEGQEKRLQLQTSGGSSGLRQLGRSEWSEILTAARCTILSTESNSLCDAYVLSESSLFVYDDGLMIKTCGTTSLLHILPRVLEVIYSHGASIAHVRFTHSQLLFPTEQPFPHKTFDSEVEYLQRFFPEGEAHVLGHPDGDAQHHIFVATYSDTAESPLSRPVLELIMTGLDKTAMQPFFRDGVDSSPASVRHASGIHQLLPPECLIDEQLFEPCGYSANALSGPGFISIHVTPEDHCSFVSFETSVFGLDCASYISQVAAVLNPSTMSVVLSGPGALPELHVRSVGGYTVDHTSDVLSGNSAFKKVSFHRGISAIPSIKEIKVRAVQTKSAAICNIPLRAIADTCVEEMLSLIGDQYNMKDLRELGPLGAVAQHVKQQTLDDPFYLVDLGVVAAQYRKWVKCLPRVRPHYAVKAAPDPAIVKLLHMVGAGFDCASKAEINLVRSVGVPADAIIYANPCKLKSHLRFAQEQSVMRMTFDNEAELYKIAEIYPQAQLVLRVVTDDSNSICRFSNKFGAELCDCKALICKAMELNLSVIGVSFHVGSGCQDTDSFVDALGRARSVFGQMQDLGLHPWLLDIGGGFPGTDDEAVTFEEIAAVIGPAIDELFDESIAVIAEPGRFFCAASHTLVANVYARRAVVDVESDATDSVGDSDSSRASQPGSKMGYLYYMNDGVYGSFNCIFFDHAVIQKWNVHDATSGNVVEQRPSYKSTLFGPTCDGLDTVLKDVQLPLMQTGEWISFPNMGAYTRAASSNFNGMHQHEIYYVRT